MPNFLKTNANLLDESKCIELIYKKKKKKCIVFEIYIWGAGKEVCVDYWSVALKACRGDIDICVALS